MRRIIKNKKIKVLKTLDDNNLGSIARVFISSFVIVMSFYALPLIIDFTNDKILNSKEFRNNSKEVLAYTLDNQTSGTVDVNEQYDERDLLVDIYSLNEKETDAVRLDASTIKQLFEDTDYELDDIRKNKLVKPIALDSFPREIKMIENTKKRKEFFIQIVLPLILQENNNIRMDRKRLFSIINKSNNTALEKKWLDKKYKQYGIPSKDLSILKIRMDEVPVSLAIAQAAKETGWELQDLLKKEMHYLVNGLGQEKD